jgi:ABC-type Na+ efflux pump permease subunit
MRNARRVLRVAAEEVTRYFRGFNKRVLLFIVFAGLVAALLLPGIIGRGVVPDEGIYRAEVAPGGALEAPARDDRQLQVQAGFGSRLLNDEADLALLDEDAFYADTERGRAAIHDFSEFTERYYDRTLSTEPNQTAAFPVRINLVYNARLLTPQQFQDQSNRPDIPSSGFTTPNDSAVLQQSGSSQLELIPGRVEPPFPMRSLLLTFVYLIPLNFVGQYYAGSLLAERTLRRGVLLLSAPLTGPQVLMGKSLPYVAFAVLFSLGATIFLQAGVLAFLAIIPVFAFFLAATCFAALIARSYRELTFLITTMSVALSTYLFLPAIFTQVHPIAFISPISVVAAGIRNEAVPLLSFLYSITPLSLAALVLGLLSAAIYREETLFTPRAITSKILDAVHLSLRRRRSFFVAGLLLIPFVFGAELFVLSFAASLPLDVALGMFLIGVAVVEEIAKSLPSLAHYRRSLGPRPALLVGGLVGIGFFVAEKASLLFALIGLDLLPLGRTLLASYGVAVGFLYVLGPILLHTVTAIMTAYGARGGRATYGLALVTAIFVHVVYNWTVIANVA